MSQISITQPPVTGRHKLWVHYNTFYGNSNLSYKDTHFQTSKIFQHQEIFVKMYPCIRLGTHPLSYTLYCKCAWKVHRYLWMHQHLLHHNFIMLLATPYKKTYFQHLLLFPVLLHQTASPVANFKLIFDRCAFVQQISLIWTETGHFSDSNGQKLARIKMNTFNTRN